MNESMKDTIQEKGKGIQAAATYVGEKGKVIEDNREKKTIVNTKKDFVIQKMGKGDEDNSIGSRLRRRRRKENDNLTPRQQSLLIKRKKRDGDIPSDDEELETRSSKKRKINTKNKNLWDGKTRPSFTDETWDEMLSSVDSKTREDGVTVYQCNDGEYYPRKRDRKKRESFVTLDHIKNWKDYIYDNAEPNSEGEITKEAAKEAYNDTSNLEVMSNSDNSSKSGPKNKYD